MTRPDHGLSKLLTATPGFLVRSSTSDDDRAARRSGVELAFWTNRQVRRSGLCTSCWMSESAPDILYCEGEDCRNFARLLEILT